MDSTRTTLIHVRSYSPLSVSFPQPGVYQGNIKLILPDPDKTLLSRLGESGSQPVVVEFFAEQPISAQDLLAAIRKQTKDLIRISGQVASQIPRSLIDALQRSTRAQAHYEPRPAPLIEASNPLEPFPE